MFDATNVSCYFPKIDVLSHSHLFFVYHFDVGMLPGCFPTNKQMQFKYLGRTMGASTFSIFNDKSHWIAV